jgi:cytochrome o ubiquinol oxidase operon protein cyoD
MSTNTKSTQHFGSIASYVAGLVLSLITTLCSYLVVTSHLVEGNALLVSVLIFAFTQLIVQLLFFLHLAQESRPRWNLVFFVATVGMMLIVVLGSIWIMDHLNHNMMPTQMDQYLIRDEGMTK